jgi:aldose sugar dehydrogenase
MVFVFYQVQQFIMKNTFLLLLVLVSLSCCRKSKPPVNEPQPGDVELKTRVLNSSLSFPWEILYGPDNKIWMTERGGRISRADTATGAVTLLHTITEVVAQGEGGLLGMVLHPNFSAQPYVYVTYNYMNAGVYKEKVVRFTYSGNTLNSPLIIIVYHHRRCSQPAISTKYSFTQWKSFTVEFRWKYSNG